MFDTLLIANRGEIARRIIRTARAMGITTVAVFSDADRDAPHVREADLAYRLPGVRSADTYLRSDLIIEAARRTGAQAIHPGYGFLSESAQFSQDCVDAGLVFVGPSPFAITAMASKLESKRRVVAAGVPVAPSAEVLPGVVGSDLAALADGVGYPMLVKASAGGGGRGMRLVTDPAGLDEAVLGARREAESAFGDGTIFLERAISRARHVEVQVAADQQGTVVALADRDCSVQRRNQKIIEEAPAPGLSAETRAAMAAAAVECARSVDYEGVGTVEFLVDDAGFYFLEMNTRLQVEHPVTEAVLGIDLVRVQLDVAAGRPLAADLGSRPVTGHAIEARLYAEDPAKGYLPSPGPVFDFEPVALEGVRYDSAIESGTVVPEYYDPMLAKVIAYGGTREEAVARLRQALRGLVLTGPTINRDQLINVLGDPDFVAGTATTSLLGERPELNETPADPQGLARARCAAAVWLLGDERSAGDLLPQVSPGFRNTVGAAPVRVRLAHGDSEAEFGVRYLRQADGTTHLEVVPGEDGDPECSLVAVLHRVDGGIVDLEVDGVREQLGVRRAGDALYVDGHRGHWRFIPLPLLRDAGREALAGSCASPMPGAVLEIRVAAGDTVVAGDTLVVIEAMKMEHRIEAGSDGVVGEILVAVGEQVSAGQALVELAAP